MVSTESYIFEKPLLVLLPFAIVRFRWLFLVITFILYFVFPCDLFYCNHTCARLLRLFCGQQKVDRLHLEAFFRHTRIPTTDDKMCLLKHTDLSLKQINDWFKNKRQRDKNPAPNKRKWVWWWLLVCSSAGNYNSGLSTVVLSKAIFPVFLMCWFYDPLFISGVF